MKCVRQERGLTAELALVSNSLGSIVQKTHGDRWVHSQRVKDIGSAVPLSRETESEDLEQHFD